MQTMCNVFSEIVAAFRGMHVPPATVCVTEKCDRRTDRQTDRRTDGRTDRQTDDGQSDPYLSLCFAGDTKVRWSEVFSSKWK